MASIREKVICFECGQGIGNRSDLITVIRWLKIKAFHASCYAKSMKGWSAIGLANMPLNSVTFSLEAIGMAFVGIFVIEPLAKWERMWSPGPLDSFPRWVTTLVVYGLTLIPAGIRFYSWEKYEKRLRE